MELLKIEIEELYRMNLWIMARLRVLDPDMPYRIEKDFYEVLDGRWVLADTETGEEFQAPAVQRPHLRLVTSH